MRLLLAIPLLILGGSTAAYLAGPSAAVQVVPRSADVQGPAAPAALEVLAHANPVTDGQASPLLEAVESAPSLPVAEAAPATAPDDGPPTGHDVGHGLSGVAVAPPEEPLPSPCDLPPPPPLPVPGSGPSPGFFQGFRAPLPRASLWNPPGTPRVGLQAGHWLTEQAPEELRRLQQGSSGGGRAEWEVNLDLAERTAALLRADGVEVDILPSTIPPGYRAHVFVAIHADGDASGRLRGFKIARPGFSSIPEVDDRLVDTLYASYEPATGLPRDDPHVSLRMLYYYAFNSRRYCHSVAPGVPQAIVETGFLTSASDRAVLLGAPDGPAAGLASGIRNFLASPPR